MNFFNGNCCLKLNYFICGSKEFSSKKKKNKLKKKCLDNNNIKLNNKNDFSSLTFYEQNNINVKSFKQENSLTNSSKYNEIVETIKNIGYESSLNCSIDHRLSNQSNSTLNNQLIIKDIILHRNNLNEQLGLTLSYGITSKSTTNIYIEQIDKNSIADYQGEIQVGDQIIKINNFNVTNRNQAIQIVNQSLIICLQIIRFKFLKRNVTGVESIITEDDSGIILTSNTDFETNNQKSLNQSNYLIKKKSVSLSCLLSKDCFYSEQIEYRRCLSLNDLRNCSFINKKINNLKELIHSETSFKIKNDNEQGIVKPLPFNHYQLNQQNLSNSKQIRRYHREKLLQELITTDDEIINQLKQRKQQFQKSKKIKQRKKFIKEYSNNSTTDDFNLLNRIFLRENQKELKEKPYLAVKYQQQSIIERDKLNKIIQKYPFYHHHHHLTSQSTTNISINTHSYYPSTIFI